MTDLEKIRQACIAANPEIVELKYGCLILYKGQRMTFIRNDTAGRPWCYTGWAPHVIGDEAFDRLEPAFLKIVGRPIRLADVLLAIGPALQTKKGRIGTYRGREIDEPQGVKLWLVEVGWNLREDDLTKQSEETLAFIVSLLTDI